MNNETWYHMRHTNAEWKVARRPLYLYQRLERRRDLLRQQRIPVQPFKERMALNVLYIAGPIPQALRWVALQQLENTTQAVVRRQHSTIQSPGQPYLSHKVPGGSFHEGRETKGGSENEVVHLRDVLRIERRLIQRVKLRPLVNPQQPCLTNPTSISYIRMPRLHQSTSLPWLSPSMISGAGNVERGRPG